MTTTTQTRLTHAEGVDQMYAALRDNPKFIAVYPPETRDAAGFSGHATVIPDVFAVDRNRLSHCFDFKCSTQDAANQANKLCVGVFQIIVSEPRIVEVDDVPCGWMGLMWLRGQEFEVIREPRMSPIRLLDISAERGLQAVAFRAKAVECAELRKALNGTGETPIVSARIREAIIKRHCEHPEDRASDIARAIRNEFGVKLRGGKVAQVLEQAQ